ncbi:MAG: MlaD family protein [Casimicrobiaceae bacterium]
MPPENDTDDLPQATTVPARRARFSAIWIIPLLAAAVAIGLAVQKVLSEGPEITIVFKTADGIEAGKTFVKYKEVNIGQVTAVRLTDDFGKVEVTAKMAKSAEGLMVADAKFWVVRPRISLSGISGLSTLISGNYIGFEAGASKTKQHSYTGMEVPPIITGGAPGRQFVLKASDLGSLGIGSPVYYRRLPVGQLVAYDLAPDGKSVVIRIFVNAPYDQYVSSATRFWNASGMDVSIGANGFDVRTQSLVALLEGGLAFESVPTPMPPTAAAADASFTLYGDRATAMKQDESISKRYVLFFNESLRGLSVGAPVSFFGVPVGEVTGLGLAFDPKTLGAHPRVDIVLYPERFIASLPAGQEKAAQALLQNQDTRLALVRRMVEDRNLRAQLRTGSLITGQLFVSLGYFPKLPKVKFNGDAELPEIPVTVSTLPELEEKLGSIIDKLDRLPLDAIGADLRKNLATLEQTLKDGSALLNHIDTDIVPALKTTLDDAKSALGSAERMLTSTEATLVGPSAPGQQELRNAMQELGRAARSLRVLADYLELHPEALIRGKTQGAPPR